MAEPADALHDLAVLLRADRSVVSPHVAEPGDAPTPLGSLAAAGQRTAPAPGEYALVVEAVREGYLLHYADERARLVRGADGDLALLAGDYLYALGLERLSVLGDLAAVRELSDLISLAAQVHDGSRQPERTEREATALWLACASAIGGGTGGAHEEAKEDVRAGRERAAAALWAAAVEIADAGGFREPLEDAAAGLDFRADHLPSLG
ncbi:MAG: hypothetical protein QOI10_3242 [Solirubrobacterales bacterium]|nr:hypothetical protein [Solirubrobacterales bacterium]